MDSLLCKAISLRPLSSVPSSVKQSIPSHPDTHPNCSSSSPVAICRREPFQRLAEGRSQAAIISFSRLFAMPDPPAASGMGTLFAPQALVPVRVGAYTIMLYPVVDQSVLPHERNSSTTTSRAAKVARVSLLFVYSAKANT